MSSGNISANIESIVNNLNEITWEQVIFEAITNSLQANAKNIEVRFTHLTLDLENIHKSIEKLNIIDDGEGFHDNNTNSFKEYGSQYKKKKLDISAKGIGRFLYLKLFEKVKIESLDKEINFSMNQDIDVNILNKKKYDKTNVTFTKSRYRFIVNFDKLEQKIRDHFIAYFKLLGNNEVIINLYENDKIKTIIKSSEIPKFKTKSFSIKNHNFILDYVFNNEDITFSEGYYCAGDRVVVKNSNLDTKKKLKAFRNIKILYLLSSSYLDENVDSTRANFTIYPVRIAQQNIFQNTSWKDIQIELKKQIKIIAKENEIDIEKIAKDNLDESIIKAPYLAYYLQENEDSYSVETLIDNAKIKLEEDKKFLRYEPDEVQNYQALLSIITQAELSEYIYDRQKTIDRLREFTNDNRLEKEIHNLFMKQNTSDDKQNYKTNKLWLFDDRFMTYDKIFSEAQLNKIFPKLIKNTKRPDILSLSVVSNTYTKEDITDIVIIELKRPSENIDPSGAETQLLRYSRYINDLKDNNKIRIWSYAFLKFNEETEFDLDNKSYNKIPVQGQYPIYYKYYEKPNTIINFLDYHSMADDANNRNKTFMKILSGDAIKE